jgi:hypothetical protein
MANEIENRLKKIEQALDQKQLLDVAFNHFKSITPVDSGNAKRNTRKQGSDSIHADYAYAGRLNRGWSSQANDGMSKPTIVEIQKYLKKV